MQHILLKSKNAVVVGEGSIARFCLELVISKGYAVQAVITGDQQLANWVTSQGIAVIKWQGEADLDQSLGAYTIDLLVSVGNLYPIPAAVLSCVRSSDGLALNVHDGPMHDFLGFNTPAWAILNGKAQHQVCWHTITPALYQGDLLSQVDIEIEPEETAMTLNAKCFAAALTSFELILERLEQSGVELHPGPQPDLTQVNYFLRKQRPATSGYLDPQASLAQTLTQLRAFDTGHTHNPLCLPKIRLNEQVWHVTSAECRETDLGQALSGQVSLGQVGSS